MGHHFTIRHKDKPARATEPYRAPAPPAAPVSQLADVAPHPVPNDVNGSSESDDSYYAINPK